jgi:hypothetical protein
VGGGPAAVFGQNGGLNFFFGHCDMASVQTSDLSFASPVRVQLHTGGTAVFAHTPAERQGFFYGRAWSCISGDPGRAVVLLGRSMLDMTATSIPFPPWTDSRPVILIAEVANILTCLLLVVLVVAALRRAGRSPVSRTLVLHLSCAFVSAAAFLGEPRYRVPYDLFVWALLGWWVASRDGRSAPPVTDPDLTARSRPAARESPP